MKSIVLLPLCLTVLFLTSCASEPTTAPATAAQAPAETSSKPIDQHAPLGAHPMPTQLHFLSADRFDAVKKTVATFPAPGSVEQRADELNLISLQETRTPADCARASTEVHSSLSNFFGAPYGPLTKAQIDKLVPLFEQVHNDADFFLYKIKNENGRKRPFLYIKGLTPCVTREMTPSFPSGHATLSRLYAFILTDIFPAKSKLLLNRADQIGDDRVLAGMHHRSDILAGQALAERLYKEFEKSPEFRKTLAGYEAKF